MSTATAMIFNRSGIVECNGVKESSMALGEIFDDGLPQMRKDAFSCLPSCQKTSFDIEIHRIHENSFLKTSDNQGYFAIDTFCISLAFQTLLVEIKTEMFIFDLSSFLSAVGGNLGLALGFSCLTVLRSSIKYLISVIQVLGK